MMLYKTQLRARLTKTVCLFWCFLFWSQTGEAQTHTAAESMAKKPVPHRAALQKPKAPLKVAVFAGGCFWCMESEFEELSGVRSVISGYTGGPEIKPSYSDVARGKTGHQEAVWVVYDSRQLTYSRLVEIFWTQIDPTQDNGQFADIGTQYETVIFYDDDQEKQVAEASKKKLELSQKFGERKIVTQIKPLGAFWPAEFHHQDYYRLHPIVYKRYYEASGRGPFIRENWPKEKKND